ncbi:MAG: acylneuraminate cytidylyltransferase family protein [Paracoccaceae bacterium]|jgi:N-acylneuraminate cytidylyltransferase|nr:acylneuraminate cytidylyltransferase family protein [Paracoccaceae bacterium]MDP7184932.1 acylneuraminate cytidylyltransferase family protein [Paracoccaceae bacterium]
MTRAVALIPIRSNSKGIPNKNIREIAGKPLVTWTIEHCRASEKIDRVIVSTDSEAYADIARQAGAEVPFLRPDDISDDTSSTEVVMMHLDDYLSGEGYDYDAMVLAQATSPVRRPGLVDDCITRWETTGADSLLTVTLNESFFWRRGPDGAEATYDHMNRPRRQDIAREDVLFRETGSLYVTARHILQTLKNRLGGKIEAMETSKLESFEIDDLDDWRIIEAILREKNTWR